MLTVIDPDPDGDGDASDGAVVGAILLANDSPGAGVTDGVGGQGLLVLPRMNQRCIRSTVARSGSGELSSEVEAWIAQLTAQQKDPSGARLTPTASLR